MPKILRPGTIVGPLHWRDRRLSVSGSMGRRWRWGWHPDPPPHSPSGSGAPRDCLVGGVGSVSCQGFLPIGYLLRHPTPSPPPLRQAPPLCLCQGPWDGAAAEVGLIARLLHDLLPRLRDAAPKAWLQVPSPPSSDPHAMGTPAHVKSIQVRRGIYQPILCPRPQIDTTSAALRFARLPSPKKERENLVASFI